MNEHETVGRIGASGLAVALLALAAGTASAQPLQLMVMSDGTELDELRRVDVLVDSLVRADELVATSRQPDPQVPGREHESLKQFHEGVPVDGGGVSRQLARGVTVSIFGTIHQGIKVNTVPLLGPEEALRVAEQRANAGPATDEGPELA